MSADPDKELADALSRTPKIVRDAIIWEALDEHRHRFTVRVYAPEMKVVLELVGNIGHTNNSFPGWWSRCRQTRHPRPRIKGA